RHTRFSRDWSSDVCSSDLNQYRMKRKYLGFHCVVERAGAVYVMSGRARSETDVTVELVYATFWDFRGGKDVTRPLRGVEFEIAADRKSGVQGARVADRGWV